jgi:hypothetical protein
VVVTRPVAASISSAPRPLVATIRLPSGDNAAAYTFGTAG